MAAEFAVYEEALKCLKLNIYINQLLKILFMKILSTLFVKRL